MLCRLLIAWNDSGICRCGPGTFRENSILRYYNEDVMWADQGAHLKHTMMREKLLPLSNLRTERGQFVLIFILIQHYYTREPMRSSQLETLYGRVVCEVSSSYNLRHCSSSRLFFHRPAINQHTQQTIDVWIRGVVVQSKEQVATTLPVGHPVIVLEQLLAASTDHTVSWIFHRAGFTFKVRQKKQNRFYRTHSNTKFSMSDKQGAMPDGENKVSLYSDGLRMSPFICHTCFVAVSS